MNSIYQNFSLVCWDCFSLNGSSFLLVYASFVFFVGMAHKPDPLEAQMYPQDMPIFFPFQVPCPSIQTMILHALSFLLTPRSYMLIIQRTTNAIDTVTGVNRRSMLKNIVVFFLFYYLIVSAPAASMVPIHYNATYNLQSIAALFLMMLTNAIGDVISYKITIANVRRLNTAFGLWCNNRTQLANSAALEFTLYVTTIIDMLLALAICIVVLILTSIYFGVSVGEYRFEFSASFINGASSRFVGFWDTAWEPYWFRENIINQRSNGLPMLLIYSVSSFVPSLVLILFSLIWTFLMPLRIIFSSNLNKYAKIIFAELVVLAICIMSLSLWRTFL